MSDEAEGKPGPLVRAPDGWRGDEHKLQVQAAQEAGLPATQVALDLCAQCHGPSITSASFSRARSWK